VRAEKASSDEQLGSSSYGDPKVGAICKTRDMMKVKKDEMFSPTVSTFGQLLTPPLLRSRTN